MDGFKRPARPPQQPPAVQPGELPSVMPLSEQSGQPPVPEQPRVDQAARPMRDPKDPYARKSILSLKRLIPVICLPVVLILVGVLWYWQQLKPANPADDSDQKVVINGGDSVSTVANRLKERGIIRDAVVFGVYAKVSGKANIKEGTCVVKRSQSAQQILGKLTAGCHDFKAITFYPGATIEKPLYKPTHAQLNQTMYIKYRLKDAGYSDPQIDAALSKQYTGPLFADKPAGTSLEGYIYGETYYVDTNATAEQVLQTTFDQMYTAITDAGLLDKFKKQGLNLYQAITLASIVQRELNCEGKPTAERKARCYGYQQTIAQIFLKRLREGTSLGSDVTFIYAADMKGVTPTVDLDSPYNTRIHTGLPPGPIASPGLLALKAIGNPSDTDYLFFIAGDNGLIYFAKDQAGHEANIRDHCQQLCNEL